MKWLNAHNHWVQNKVVGPTAKAPNEDSCPILKLARVDGDAYEFNVVQVFCVELDGYAYLLRDKILGHEKSLKHTIKYQNKMHVHSQNINKISTQNHIISSLN